LQNKTKSQHLIELLEDFVEDNDDKQYESDNSQEIDSLEDEKENSDSTILYIQNPKIHRSRGRSKGTKCLKSAHEVSKTYGKSMSMQEMWWFGPLAEELQDT
ncbi:14897_t:CDS:1, partial [Dentiscutata heterogama]